MVVVQAGWHMVSRRALGAGSLERLRFRRRDVKILAHRTEALHQAVTLGVTKLA